MSDAASGLDATLKIVEILSVLGAGGLALLVGGRIAGRIETSISALQEDVRKLNELVTSVALQGQRLDTHDRRMDMMEQRWEDLRRGEGYVLPLERSYRAKPAKSE